MSEVPLKNFRGFAGKHSSAWFRKPSKAIVQKSSISEWVLPALMVRRVWIRTLHGFLAHKTLPPSP